MYKECVCVCGGGVRVCMYVCVCLCLCVGVRARVRVCVIIVALACKRISLRGIRIKKVTQVELECGGHSTCWSLCLWTGSMKTPPSHA